MSEAALKLKEKGNQCFREHRYNNAAKFYTESLECQVDPIVLGNRAQTYIQLGWWYQALMDCNKALHIKPELPKVLYRRASVLEHLELFELAYNDAVRCCNLVADQSAKTMAERLKGKENTKSIDVQCFEKGDEIRFDDAFVNIPIDISESYTVDEPAQSVQLPEKSTETPEIAEKMLSMNFVDHLPSTYADFSSFSSTMRNDPVAFTKYFMKIPTTDYHGLFDDLLDKDTVSILLTGLPILLHEKYIEPEQVTKCLLELSDVSRFDMISMFLGKDDKKNLFSICDRLNKADAIVIQVRFSS